MVDSRLEESEEEDSDEDISKYDLFGDDESDEKDEKRLANIIVTALSPFHNIQQQWEKG